MNYKLICVSIFVFAIVLFVACSPNISEDINKTNSVDDEVLQNLDDEFIYREDYISEVVLDWLGQDDLHPLIVSIFPNADSSCPVNYHEKLIDGKIACARIKDGFEYRINNVIHGELLNSSTEIVEE